jgi:hypothetical protein
MVFPEAEVEVVLENDLLRYFRAAAPKGRQGGGGWGATRVATTRLDEQAGIYRFLLFMRLYGFWAFIFIGRISYPEGRQKPHRISTNRRPTEMNEGRSAKRQCFASKKEKRGRGGIFGIYRISLYL